MMCFLRVQEHWLDHQTLYNWVTTEPFLYYSTHGSRTAVYLIVGGMSTTAPSPAVDIARRCGGGIVYTWRWNLQFSATLSTLDCYELGYGTRHDVEGVQISLCWRSCSPLRGSCRTSADGAASPRGAEEPVCLLRRVTIVRTTFQYLDRASAGAQSARSPSRLAFA